MSAQPKQRWTAEKYLAFERAHAERHELIDGEIVMISGASRNHNLIVVNTGSSLHRQLRSRPCEVYTTDMRVRITARTYVYPNIVIVCGDPVFEDESVDTLLNPTAVIEVLSPSTMQYDRAGKFAGYRTLASLSEYITISQNDRRLEHYIRQANGQWLLTDVIGEGAQVTLQSVDCTLLLDEIYEKVSFESADD